MYKKYANKTKKKYFNMSNYQNGGGGASMDLQSLSDEDIKALFDQGISAQQIADIAREQDQPIPPLVAAKLEEEASGQPQQMQQMNQVPQGPPLPSKTSKFPAMMDASTYNKYREVDKLERKSSVGAHKPNVFGYVFSDLISEEILHEMKRTQGSFFVGVNLSNLFSGYQNTIINNNSKSKNSGIGTKNSEGIFKRVGEWVDVDFEKILEKKMGFRGSDLQLLPETKLSDYSTFYEIIDESKKYASSSGYDTKITPYGLLMMTRMLFKYRKSNAQWFRVATILELIYKYLGVNQTRQTFFNTKYEIPIMSLMDLEEFYNTDHIFMSEKDLSNFKKDLNYYKYDTKLDILMKLKEIKKTVPTPPI